MKVYAPPPLVLLAALSALALLVLGIVSQRNYAPMDVPDNISYTFGTTHYGPYSFAFTMTQVPPDFKAHPCRFEFANQPSTRCRWRMYLIDQTYEDRVRLLLHEGSGATNHPLTVRYGDAETEEPATAEAPAPPHGFWENDRMRTLAVYAAIFAAFGLLVLWRGRDAAVWLGLFCVCLAPFFLNFYGALGPDGMVRAWTLGVVLRRLADFALFAMALVLVAQYLRPRVVLALAIVGVGLAALGAAVAVVPKYEGIYRGVVDGWLDASKGHTLGVIEILLLGALPLALLIAGMWKAREPERSRLAIIASVVALGLLGPLVDGTLNGADHFGELWATALIIPIGFTYAIPRYHVIDAGFVINRLAIYVLLVATVSAAIAFAEVLITKFAESPAAFAQDFQRSLVQQAPIVFVIVLSLRWVHQRLEEFVNQVLFRKRHKALNELKDFILRTDFAQTREGLLRGTVHEIERALGTRGVAVYEKAPNGYRRVEHVGAFAQHVGEDDPAIWFLRADRRHVRLHGIGSALGESGIAFPMCLRSGLYGAIVCGPRVNEEYEGDYAPDELDVMDELAMRVAEQLYALAADDRLAFINDVASGEIGGEALRERARELRSTDGAAQVPTK